MKTKSLVTVAIALLSATPLVFAQGGGGGGPHAGPPQGQERPGAGPRAPEGEERSQRAGDRDQDRDRDRERIRATDRQREQIRTCSASADRARAQAREMERISKGRSFDASAARQQRDRVHAELQGMLQEHEQMAKGMSEEQRARLQERLRTIEQTRERLAERLQEMERALGEGSPDAGRVAEQARLLERETQEWRRQHRSLARDMGVNP